MNASMTGSIDLASAFCLEGGDYEREPVPGS
jgi:hypothetical protein